MLRLSVIQCRSHNRHTTRQNSRELRNIIHLTSLTDIMPIPRNTNLTDTMPIPRNTSFTQRRT